MSLRFLTMTALAITLPLPAFAATAHSAGTFTIDDALHLEDVGGAAFSPAGDVAVFTRVPAVADLPDHGIDQDRIVLGTLMIVDANKPAAAHVLFEPEARALYSLVGFSPTGRFVTFLRVRDGQMHMGVFDRTRRATRIFATRPEFNGVQNLTPLWITPETLLFVATDPEGPGPLMPFMRRGTAAAFEKAWSRSWAGNMTSKSVLLSGPRRGPTSPYAGTLVKADATTGATRVIAQGAFADLRLSPDGRLVSAVQLHQVSDVASREDNGGWTTTRGVLSIFDLATDQVTRPVPDLDISYGSVEWAPSRNALAFFAWHDGEASGQGRFHTLDLATRRLAVLPHTGLDLASEREDGPPARPFRALWIGSDLVVAARQFGEPRAKPAFTPKGIIGAEGGSLGKRDWFRISEILPPIELTEFAKTSPAPLAATPAGAYLLIDGQIWRFPPAGAPARIAKEFTGTIEEPPLMPMSLWTRAPFEARQLLPASIGSTRHQILADLDAGRVRDLGVAGTARPLALADTTGVTLTPKREEGSSALMLQQPGGKAAPVWRFNAFVSEFAKPIGRSLAYHLADGSETNSCLILPPDYQPGRRYPMVVHAYPASRPHACPEKIDLQAHRNFYNLPLLAAQGYVVLDVSSREREIRSEEGGPLANMAPAILRAVDSAIEQGYADPERIGMWGLSGSAFTGIWTASQTDRFKAVVAINGISNLLSHYYTKELVHDFYPELYPFRGNSGRYDNRVNQFGMGFTPWDRPMTYWNASPIAHAGKISTPILLVGSDMDGSFSAQFDEFFVALNRLGKTAEYIRYWGEGHGPASPANQRDLWRRTLEWFDLYLRRPATAENPSSTQQSSAPSPLPKPSEAVRMK
jgi:hypothetical protein